MPPPTLLRYGTVIIVPIGVISPPGRERMSRATGAKDSEGEDEENGETGSIKSTSHQVRVVLEDAWAIVSEVELDKEARDQLTEDNASLALVVGDVASKLDKLGQVDVCDIEVLDLGVELGHVSFGSRQ